MLKKNGFASCSEKRKPEVSIQRLYRPDIAQGASQKELGREDFHYIKNVLRLKPGDGLLLFDGKGTEYNGTIREFGKKKILVDITASDRVEDDAPPIILAQALPKENKMDFIIQKATELGVSRIIPFTSSRTVPKLSGDKAAARLKRWRKIAAEASKQCGSSQVPEVTDLHTFETMLDEAGDRTIKLFFWEEESRLGIGDILRGKTGLAETPLFIAVGPEGGFSGNEADLARRRGFTTAHLGRRILRVETASLVILSILQYERGTMHLSSQQKGTQ